MRPKRAQLYVVRSQLASWLNIGIKNKHANWKHVTQSTWANMQIDSQGEDTHADQMRDSCLCISHLASSTA